MDRDGIESDNVAVGISVRNGPVQDDMMEVDTPLTNGHAKRKSRGSASKPKYKDDTDASDDDDAPLVRN